MKPKILLALIVSLTLTLVGCGGGGGSASETPTTPAVQISGTPTASVSTGAQVQLSAKVVNGTDQTINWTASAGTVTQQGLLTAPTTAGTVTVTATSPTYKVQATATIQVAVQGPITIKISGPTTPVYSYSQALFTATVTGTTNQTVYWSVVDQYGGSIQSNGIYTASTDVTTQMIQAVSAADDNVYARYPVTIATNLYALKVVGATAIHPGASTTYTSTTGPLYKNLAADWSIVGNPAGVTISSTGVLSVAATTASGIYDIRATVDQAQSQYCDFLVVVG